MKKKSLNVKNKIHKKILKYLNNKKIFKIYKEFELFLLNKGRFSVAVSGGPDSLALVFVAKCFSILNKIDIKYYLVDHRLRKNSSQEAKKVFLLLKKFDINCKILIWKGRKPKSNIQAIARNKRYYLLNNQCKKDKINYLTLGHHIDDMYENFLIRLLRGSGLKGLTSFGKNSEYKKNEVKLLRPLINLEKKDLIYLSKKIFNFYVEDPSNLNENFKRIRIRKLINLLESEGLDKKKLRLTINNLKDADQTIKFYIKNNIEVNSIFSKKDNTFLLNLNFFEQPHEIIFRSLLILMRSISKNYYAARGKSVTNLILRIKSKNFKKTTLGGCFFEKINETILISLENDPKDKIL
jgi:tRNA(Ile)-lysidine synthase